MRKSIIDGLKTISVLMMWGYFLGAPLAMAAPKYPLIRNYIEQKKDATHHVRWTLNRENGYRLTYKSGTKVHITCTDEMFATVSWTMNDSAVDCAVQAQRKKNTIVVQGTCEGDKISRRIDIDDDPWFQATSLSFAGFALSKEKEIQFWTLRPGFFKTAHKLKATKVGYETVMAAGTPVKTVKIKLSLKGWLAPLWKSYYWFDESGGLFVKFEGQADASADSRYTIIYTGTGKPETETSSLK